MLSKKEKLQIINKNKKLVNFIDDLLLKSLDIDNTSFNNFTLLNPYGFFIKQITVNRTNSKQKRDLIYFQKLQNKKINNLIKKYREIFLNPQDNDSRYMLYKEKIDKKTELLFAIQDKETGFLLINHGIVSKIQNTLPHSYKEIFYDEKRIQKAIFQYYNYFCKIVKNKKIIEVDTEITLKDHNNGYIGRIDLYIELKNKIYLSELKHKFNRANLYRAIGQTEVYSRYVERELKKEKPIFQNLAGIKNNNLDKLYSYAEETVRSVNFIDKHLLNFLIISGFTYIKRENLKII